MKKVFCIFLSLIAIMGLSACEPETPGNPQKPDPQESSYLTFVSSGDSSVALVKVGEPFDISLEYSIDGKSWNPYTIGEAIYLLKNEVSFRAGETGNEVFSKGKDNYYQFKISGEVAAKGNIMSLLDRTCRKNDIPSYAFYSLFRDCKGLTEAPELPATDLAEGCYACMFSGCTSLTTAPALPAMKMAEECYAWMFLDCTNLRTAPVLHATELAEYCYSYMFSACENLTTAPELPATEMKSSCYANMFSLCTSLTTAPVLPATNLDSACYFCMFNGCTSLNYVKALFTDEPSEFTIFCWLLNVAPTGTFVKSKDATWDVRGYSGIPEGWTVETDAGTSDDPQKPNPEEPSYLTFVSTGESTISLTKIGNPDPITLEYSVNGSTWTPYTIGGTITISNGENLMFRAGETGNECFSEGYNDYYKFEISGKIAVKGNIMSLLDRTCARNSVPSFAFNNLFSGCTSLTSAPELPATDLAEACYAWMFSGCESLMKAPALPATKLAVGCYCGMFIDCNSLTEAPALPAKELAPSCYANMFNTCLKLRTVPELPATNLVVGCYDHMFTYCVKLNYVKALFTDKPSEITTGEWLGGVSFTGTFVKSKNAAWDVRGISGIPEGWTVITE